MEKGHKKDVLKIAIIVLAILLGISSTALAGMILYKHLVSSKPGSVIVPDNIITPDTEKEKQTSGEGSTENKNETDSSVTQIQYSEATTGEKAETTQNQSSSVTVGINSNGSINKNRATTTLSLHNRNAGENVAFNAGNMFPGDAVTKYFCVRVSFQDTVTVKYHADIRPGHEKLAEVLKCRIVLLTTGETFYDGLMRDMPESLNHSLYSAEGTTSDLYYEITAYLDSSVGNAYQNKTLIADFSWWVEEESHLIEAPKTRDDSNTGLWAGLAYASLFILILLLAKRKQEEQYEQ